MACTTKTNSIVLDAAYVSWGREEKTCIHPVAGLLGGESFIIATQNLAYQVWFDLDNGSVAPTPSAGETLVEVDIATGHSAANVATALNSALDALSGFESTTTEDGLSVKVSTVKIGAVYAATADVDSGFTFEQLSEGIGGDLGKTKEGIEVSFETTLLDVKANQTGELLLDQIIQGVNASLSMSLLEVTKERLSLIFGEGFGNKYTPSLGTEVVGFGTSRNFKSSFEQGGKLILHPVRLESTDRSEDVVFWKTIPSPESINYDGTDTKALSCSFSALVDEEKRSEINIFAIGDWQQDLRA